MCTIWSDRWLKCLLMVACVCAPGAAVGQGFTVTANSGRPLAAMVTKLEEKFSWVVTYEDPQYLNPADSVDVTQAVRRTPGPGRTLVPRGGPFTFVAPAEIDPVAPQEPEVLRALLEQYAASGYPGTFVLERTGSIFHIVPTGTRDADGASVPYASILDSRIVAIPGQRTALDAIEMVLGQLNGQVVLGSNFTELLRQTDVSQNAANDTARNLLVQILRATGRPLSWQMFCDPGGTHMCALNIQMVGVPGQAR